MILPKAPTFSHELQVFASTLDKIPTEQKHELKLSCNNQRFSTILWPQNKDGKEMLYLQLTSNTGCNI